MLKLYCYDYCHNADCCPTAFSCAEAGYIACYSTESRFVSVDTLNVIIMSVALLSIVYTQLEAYNGQLLAGPLIKRKGVFENCEHKKKWERKKSVGKENG